MQTSLSESSPTPPVTPGRGREGMAALFTTFAKAGGTAIAGSYATIRPLREALVRTNGWMSDDDFDKAVDAAQAMPGVFGLNFAAYLGHRLCGWKGATLALTGMILPPFVIMIVIAGFFNDLRDAPAMQSFLRGVRPAVIALMVVPFLQMLKRSQVNISTIWIPIGAALAVWLLKVSPVFIVLVLCIGAGLYGWLVRPNE